MKVKSRTRSRALTIHVAVLVTFVGAFPILAQNPSASKLSAHLINAYTTGASNIISGNPRLLKILDVGGDMLKAARAYKASTPGGKLVLRVYTQNRYTMTDDPAVSATNYWSTVLQPALNGLSAADRALLDYLEGPNEGDSTPTWQSLESAQWYSAFWQSLSPLIAGAGLKPCIGSIAVGNPPGSDSQLQSFLNAFVPALRQAKALGGAWSYHAYTTQYSTDEGVEVWYSLRYRQFYTIFSTYFQDLKNMPLILTEGGVDQSGDPATSGWQARGSAADYQRWLNWFDRQLSRDPYVLGCTLFQVGNPTGWSSFDLEPIAAWMGNYLRTPTAVPGPPTGVTVVATNGTALLRWAPVPLSPTYYRIQRALIAGGGGTPYSTVATFITEGVKATSWTDLAVTNGGSYLYLVSAVNALGEGRSSDPAGVTMPDIKLPDVVVTAVSWTPARVFAGTNITFRATVKNQGTGSTPAGTVLGIGFSIDGSANVSWSGNYSSALAPGSSVTLAASGGPIGKNTWSATPGMHTLTAVADDINRFPELNEANNAMSLPLAIAGGPPRLAMPELQGSNSLVLSFSATAGITYILQYKDDLDLPSWLNLGIPLLATTNSIRVIDTAHDGDRFYRVVQQ